ncbi:MAG: hypothetical protein LBR32_04125 [Propionibacteriaceae bacterium]|jgi:superfamily II DNA or RNA helicase|nr:hypothetical protein [Propionibacteriaceae bacterium]
MDTVFLASPIAFPGLLQQAVGRIMRRHPDKADVVVHDYVDPAVGVCAHQFANRQRAYRQMGFTMIAESRDRP